MSIFGRNHKRLSARQQKIQAVAETDDGKALFVFLMRLTQGEEPCFDPNPQVMAFNAGRQSIWLELRREMDKDMREIIRQAEVLDRQQAQLEEEHEEYQQ